jgi:hypothetical protein
VYLTMQRCEFAANPSRIFDDARVLETIRLC